MTLYDIELLAERLQDQADTLAGTAGIATDPEDNPDRTFARTEIESPHWLDEIEATMANLRRAHRAVLVAKGIAPNSEVLP